MNSSLAEMFSFRTLGRDSLGGILPWPRGFLSNSLGREAERFLSYYRQGFTCVNSSLAEMFSFRTLGRDSLG